jgi:hypothetical protein
VRWFSTLAQQQHFAAVLGPVSLAAAPFAPAGGDRKERKPSGKGPPGEKAAKEKPGKERKAPKPDKAAKLLPNGGHAGAAACRHMPGRACGSSKLVWLEPHAPACKNTCTCSVLSKHLC